MRKTIAARKISGRKALRQRGRGRIRSALLASALMLGAGTMAAPVHAQSGEQHEIEIAAQSLDGALNDLARQVGKQIVIYSEDAGSRTVSPIAGSYTEAEALRLLLRGTGLRYRYLNARTIVVGTPQRLASNGSGGPGGEEERYDEEEPVIIVTGTNIRGVAPVGSPVETYSRDEIDESGRATVQDFVQTLPQNFGGGVSEGSQGGLGGSGNINFGTGVNLRGLGNDSTLVLLNGRRLAPAGLGVGVDISMIPLAAVERVEILTDGASAIYGSDAVGGVVNFRLREDYDGAETRLRYGTATSGDLDEIQFGQTFGRAWSSGNALISYEYYQRDNLDANDRDFSENAAEPTDLLPRQERHSVFFAGRQDLGEAAELFGDAFYSKRESDSFGARSSGTIPVVSSADTEQFGVSLGSQIELSEAWQAELAGSFSRTEVSNVRTDIDTDVSQIGLNGNFTTWSLDAKLDGPLIRLSGGDVRVAIGGHFRRETRRSSDGVRMQDTQADRNVYAIFGELNVPLVGEQNRTPGIERLEFTVAGRYEDYSDFGSSFDPKIGALWSPFDGLDLRGTFGTSFRAPLFRELDTATSTLGFLLFLPDPSSPTGTTLSVLGRGGNPDLGPESATTWTAGFDFSFPPIPELTISATYFDIDFENRIKPTFPTFAAFTNPRFEPLLDRNPDPALLAFFGSLPASRNFNAPGFEFTDAEVFVDERFRNVAALRTRGLDFDIAYALESTVGGFEFAVGGSYLFEQSETLLAGDESVDVLDTTFNPPDFRLRGSISWAHQGLSSNLSVNYVDGYRDDRVDPVAPVDSWTTVDLYVAYDTGAEGASWLRNTIFSLSALNIFDEDPPFIEANFNSVNYDPTNANALGRTIAFQITKQW